MTMSIAICNRTRCSSEPTAEESSMAVQRPAHSPAPAWVLENMHSVQPDEMLPTIPLTVTGRPPRESRSETQPAPEWVLLASRQRARWLERHRGEAMPCIETPMGVNKQIIRFTRARP